MLPVDLRGIWKTLPPESEVSICLLLSWVKMVVALPSSYGLSLGSLLGNWEDKQGDPDLGSAWPWWALSPSGCHLSSECFPPSLEHHRVIQNSQACEEGCHAAQ